MEVSGGGDGKVLKILFPVPEIPKDQERENETIKRGWKQNQGSRETRGRIKRMSDRKGRCEERRTAGGKEGRK